MLWCSRTIAERRRFACARSSSAFWCLMTLLVAMTGTTLLRSAVARPLGLGIATQLFLMTHNKSVSHCDGAAKKSVLPSNPLLQQSSVPLFDQINPSHVVPAIENDLSLLKNQFGDLVKRLEGKSGNPQVPSYENVVEELEKIQAPLSYSWGVVGHLMGVRNSDDLRKAHETMQPQVIETYQQIGQNEEIFKAFKAIRKAALHLDEAQERILDSSIQQMHLSGVDLTSSQKEEFNKLQMESAELATKFSNNVLDSTKAFQLRVTNKSELAGLPDSALALAAQRAVKNGDKEATAESGPWVITLDLPSYLPCMQHLKNREIREKLYRAYVTRASQGETDNANNIQRILQLKTRMSQILGFDCHAEKSLATKMASSVDEVMGLIEMLREKSFPAAQKEMKELRDFAKTQGCNDDLQLWDIAFWSERLREAQYEYKEEELREYLAYPMVLQGLFQLANRLFGVTISEAPAGEVPVWNPDVKFYHIVDENKKHIASFYLDPYSRPGEKNGGAWMNVCLGKSKVMHRNPVAYLICNGSPPVDGKPSLMTFREVETLFHEFGHGLQHMLTTIEHGEAAGISNVEWDAVELPSQFMENWCYDEKTLYSFAKHYETGAPLPAELFKKVKDAKNFQAGMMMLRQLFFGATDMFLHSKAYNAFGSVSPFEIQRELSKKYTVIPPLPEDKFLCSFSHIFAGGYSAGYYSYKWAEVMSADAFAAFEEAGLENEQAVRATGRRFRDTVLALGGGKHPSDVYKLYRGRGPSPEALLRHSGLA